MSPSSAAGLEGSQIATITEDGRYGVLPDGLSPVVQAIGVSGALALVHTYAGSRIYIPQSQHLGDEHPLVGLLGRALAEKLARAVGPGYITVPVARAFLKAEREQVIVARATAGESYADIAQSFGVTERAVQNLIVRARRGEL